MRVYILYFLVFILPLGIASKNGRKIANIFVEDDRVSVERSSMPAIGSIHTKAELKSIIGTGFLIDACHVATSYHLIKSNNEKISREDYIFFKDGVSEEFVKAKVTAFHGRPHSAPAYEQDLEDWVILKLETCSQAIPLELKKLSLADLQNKELKLYGFPRDRNIDYLSLDPSCSVGHEPNPNFRGVPHDCAVRAGNSGGPLIMEVDGAQYVVAIQSSRRKGFDDVFSEYMSSWANMATPVGPLVESFKSLKSNHQQEAASRLYRAL